MIFADDIRKVLLRAANAQGNQSLDAVELAKSIDPVNWKPLAEQIQLVADAMIREGTLKCTLRKH